MEPLEDRYRLHLLSGNVTEVFKEPDLSVEGSTSRIIPLLGRQPARALVAIVEQQVSAFLMTHQLQAVIDEDQGDATIEWMADRQFAHCAV